MLNKNRRSKRARRAVVGAFLVAAFALTATVASATGTLDQSQPGPGDIWAIECQGKEAQTFTAGLTGLLDTVELQVSREGEGETAGDVVISILGADSLANPGAPDEQDVLATQTIAENDIPQTDGNVQTVVFDNPASVQAGTKYAIMLTAPDCIAPEHGFYGYAWGMVDGDEYTAGDSCDFFSNSWDCNHPPDVLVQDFIFATYVTVPPSADVAVDVSGPESAKKGALATYFVTVSNTGPDTAHNVVVSAPVPAGASLQGVTTTKGSCASPRGRNPTISCALGDLAASTGANATVTLKITAKVGSNIGGFISANSTADGGGPATPDPDTSNNSDSLSTTVTK